jgi:carbon monoxide dehydrogenase subunit G
MHIEGTYTLLAPPERVWHGMRDQQMLLCAVPGIGQIEALDEHTFTISLSMDQEPFIGNYQGKLTISEQQFPYHYRVTMQGTNNQGQQFRGEITIHLQDRDECTIVAYTGTVHLDAIGQSASATLARGAAKLLIQQFFTALSDQLQVNEALDTDFAAVVERYDLYNVAEAVGVRGQSGVILKRNTTNYSGTIPQESSSAMVISEQGSIFSMVVHLLGLGHGEVEQEQVWTRRLRRGSAVAGLLFLVWLGTRLPRPRAREQRVHP